MNNIGLIGDFTSNYVVKSGVTFKPSFFLKNLPSGNVTASFASTNSKFTVTASLTFTTGNYFTPQAITITAVEDSLVHGYQEDILTVTLSGGGFSDVKTYTVRIIDSGIGGFFVNGFNWLEGIDKTLSSSNVATARAAVIDFVFNGSGMPTNATPSATTSSFTGLMHGGVNTSGLSGHSSVDKLTFTRDDVDGYTWTNICYHIKNSSSNGKLVIYHMGHSSDDATSMLNAINNRLSHGYDVLFCGMASQGDNTEGNPNITGANHNHYTEGLDRVGYTSIELFLFDKIEALNYMDANYSFSEYSIFGLSGGGWTTCLLGAIDTRLEKVMSLRGIRHRPFKQAPGPFNSENDYEQGGSALLQVNCGPRVFDFYSDHSFVNLICMAASGGRKSGTHNHAADASTNLGGYDPLIWKSTAEAMAIAMGGTIDVYVDDDAGRTAHVIDSFTLGRMDTFFGD